MQTAFGFLAADLADWQRRLAPIVATVEPFSPRRPLAQMVKSIISGRTRDAVSQAAFDRLTAAFGSARRLSEADPPAVEREIADVTYAGDKARYVVSALRQLRTGPYGFDLERLRDLPLGSALAFLETLPGVARKVSASTLNASTLALPVLIVDTHVLRVLHRLGALDPRTDYRVASETVTGAMPHWDGSEFLTFHIGMKRLGQLVCRAELAECTSCPLAPSCPAAKTGFRQGSDII